MEQTKDNATQPQIKKSKVDEMFILVKDKDGIKITIGNFQISRKVFKTYQAAEDYLRTRPFEILINATCLFTNLQMKENEKAKNAEADK